MHCEDKTIDLYCIVDDLLKEIRHKEDSRRKVSDSDVMATALVSALYFGSHQDNAREFIKMTKLIPSMLDKSRYNRRLHRIPDLLFGLFFQLGHCLKTMAGTSDYIIDSFPVAVCDNIRISRSKINQGEQWRGKQASMRRYFYA